MSEPASPGSPEYLKLQAETARLDAERRKFDAEAEAAQHADERAALQAEVDRDKTFAETAKLAAEARSAEYSAEVAELALEKVREARAEERAQNKYHHVYHFTDSVAAQSARACMSQLAQWMRLEPGCDIEIVFSSPGGSVIDGMALWDYIQQVRAAGHNIRTHTIGYAASMAGILLQAGDIRSMGREAYLLVHEVSFGAGGKIGEVEDEVAFVKKIQSRVLDIFAARTKLTKVQLERRWRRKDWWLDSTEALKLGFVDEVR